MLPESGRRTENSGPAFSFTRFSQSGKKVKVQRVQRRQPHCSGILTVFLQQGATGVVKLLQGFLRPPERTSPRPRAQP